MPITVEDIHNKDFSRKMRGYNEIEVDEFLDRVADELKAGLGRIGELEKELRAANEQLSYLKGLETTLRDTLLTAQRSADDTVLNAQRRAEQLLASAQENGQRIEAEAVERAANANAERAAVLEAAQADADAIIADAESTAAAIRRAAEEEKAAHAAFKAQAREIIERHLAELS